MITAHAGSLRIIRGFVYRRQDGDVGLAARAGGPGIPFFMHREFGGNALEQRMRDGIGLDSDAAVLPRSGMAFERLASHPILVPLPFGIGDARQSGNVKSYPAFPRFDELLHRGLDRWGPIT